MVSQDVAERIGREARRCGLQTQIMAMDAFDLAEQAKKPLKIIFVASTTGQVRHGSLGGSPLTAHSLLVLP